VTEPDTGGRLSADERAELERLRARVSRLDAAPPAVRRRRTWPRTVVGSLLVALAALLAPLSVLAVWARGEVADTDRYVETVAPLAADPTVQAAVTTRLTDVVFRYLDVQGLTQQAVDALESGDRLPTAVADRLDGLVGPITSGVRGFTEDQIGRLVGSDVFADAWVTAQRSAHDTLVAALRGDTRSGVTVSDDAVSVNLATFITVVKQALLDQGFTLAERIPAVNAEFTVLESVDIGKAQRAYAVLDTLGYWLPFAVLALLVAGAYIAPNHRRAVIAFGVATTVTMLLLAGLLAYVRHRYLDAVPPEGSRAAAAVIFDTLVRFLRETLRSAALLGLAFAVGAFLTGPSTTATAVRRAVDAGAARIRGGIARLGVPTRAATATLAPRAGVIRAVLVAGAVIALILPAYLTPSYVLWTLLGLVLALLVLAVVVAPGRRPAPA
jgi:hypothetical protein